MKLNSQQDNLNKALKDVSEKQKAKQIVPPKEPPQKPQPVRVKQKVKKTNSDEEDTCSDKSAYVDESPEKEANSGSDDERSLALASIDLPETQTNTDLSPDKIEVEKLQEQTSTNNPNSPHDGLINNNGAISDEESNSWADSVSLSEETEKEDYYDQEEYD